MKTRFILIAFVMYGLGSHPAWSEQHQVNTQATNEWRQVLSDPEVKQIQTSMSQRYKSILKDALNNHEVGVDNIGFVQVLPNKKTSLTLAKAVLEENQNRKKLYKLISAKQNHPEWEKSIQTVFAEQWLRKAYKNGWTVITSDAS